MNSVKVTPSWLDKNFLTRLLQEDDSSMQINVLSFSAKPAVTAGNNYCCVVSRVNIEYERNGEHVHTSLIIKTPLPDGPAKNMIDEMGIIDKECLIYKELLPIMNKMINKRITAKNYYCQIPGTIILEDLKQQGYVMCDRLKQLDFDHCNTYMKVIGIFHALSLQVHKQEPELIELVGKEIVYHDNLNADAKQYFVTGFHSLASVMEEWKGYGQFSKLIRNNFNTIWERVVAIHKGKKHLRVLNHGDSWTNNLLFKYDDTGKVIDMKLIDLQVCKFASPAIDLITFIVSSAQEDVKLHRLPELYATYLDSLNSTLETIGCEERLTSEQLQDELEFVQILVICLLPFFLPMLLSELDNIIDIELAMDAYNKSDGDGKEQIRKTLSGNHFKNVAKFTLNKLEEQGFHL